MSDEPKQAPPQSAELGTSAPDVAAREDTGRRIDIMDENGEPYNPPASMVVAGRYSNIYSKAEAKVGRERLNKRTARNPKWDEIVERHIRITSHCVLSMEGFRQNGEPLACTPDNVYLMLVRWPWVREQVEEAMNDHAGFLQNGSKS